ncbi:MAG: hypothetical protein ACP5II_07855 [Infirmifilum sp.]|uniref:hypothetical protein n=1 Tax=Infirmifilum sp. TaxID=2856575 RepID=UPI003D0D617F
MRYSFALVQLDFFSPFSSVPWFAEHGRGNLAPSPSTLIGALAAVYYYPVETEIPDEFLDKVRYVTFWVPPYTEVENVSRHFSGLSQRSQRLNVLSAANNIIVKGKVDDETLNILKNYARLDREIEMFKRGEISRKELVLSATQILYQPASRLEVYYWEPAYALYVVEESLAKYVGNIFRVGSKETLVAATPLNVVKITPIGGEEKFHTRFYIPCRSLQMGCDACTGKGVVNYMATRPQSDPLTHEAEPYCLPLRSPMDSSWLSFYSSELVDGWKAVRILTSDGKQFDVVIPEDALA